MLDSLTKIQLLFLTRLRPSYMLKITSKDFEKNAKSFMESYELGDISAELDLWYNLWKKKDLAGEKLNDIEVAALLEEANIFSLQQGMDSSF